jgi:hypothetical protein
MAKHEGQRPNHGSACRYSELGIRSRAVLGPKNMNPGTKRFVVSPEGKTRLYVGLFMIGLPFAFALCWALNVSGISDGSSTARTKAIVLVLPLLSASMLAGLYYTCVCQEVTLDLANDSVVSRKSVLGIPVHSQEWRLSKFTGIEVRHQPYGESPSTTFQTRVGLSQPNFRVVWLRAFQVESEQPGGDAIAFAEELCQTTQLPILK